MKDRDLEDFVRSIYKNDFDYFDDKQLIDPDFGEYGYQIELEKYNIIQTGPYKGEKSCKFKMMLTCQFSDGEMPQYYNIMLRRFTNTIYNEDHLTFDELKDHYYKATDIMLNGLSESLKLASAIDVASSLQPYEEDFMGIGGAFKAGAKAVGNAVKNAGTNIKNAASNLNQSLNAKAQNANAKGDFVQQQKELDQQLQTFANNLSGLLTKNASGSQQKKADKQADKAAQANSALNNAKKNTQDEVDKTAEEMKNASTNEDSDSSTAAPANNGGN